MSEAWTLPIPEAIHKIFAKFPLYSYPSLDVSGNALKNNNAILWIHPPASNSAFKSLSDDVECLKWQAYMALRGLQNIYVRWDVSPLGSLDGRLPALQTPERNVLSARMIPGWVDTRLGLDHDDAFEGYRDDAAKDESRAWVSLLEGPIHVALVSIVNTLCMLHFTNLEH